MKIKIKPAYIGLGLIAIMFMSTIAFSLLQSLNYASPSPNQKTELPTTNVIDYKLSAGQEDLLLRRGFTIIEYRYSLSCEYCQQQKQFLVQLTTQSQLSNQLFLQTLAGNSDLPTVTLTSYYNQEELTNATSEAIMQALCDVVVDKPLECTLQKI